MDDDEKRPNIIIDNGGGYIKAGFSGEEGPSAVFQTMVGYPKNHVENSGDKKDYYVGKDAEDKIEELKEIIPLNMVL